MTSLHLCCLNISMVRSPLIILLPSSLSPPLYTCLSSLTATSLSSGPLLPSPPSNSLPPPPFSPLPHSYAFVSFPSLKPSIQSTPPPPMFQVLSTCMGSYQNFNIFGGPNWILLHTWSETDYCTYDSYDFKQICASDYLWGCNKSIL